MFSLPKSSAEILPALKGPQKPCKPKADQSQTFKDRLSSFNINKPPEHHVDHQNTADCSSSRPANFCSNVHFKNPVTPQTLEPALEIEEIPDVEGNQESFRELPLDSCTWVSFFF